MTQTHSDVKTKVIVLKHDLDENSVNELIYEKKTNVFKSLLRKPSRSEVHVHSVKFIYEAYMMISARYTADFFRRATHPIKVDYNVSEVILGDGVFPIRTKSAISRALSGKRGKNKVDLKLEEHVHIDTQGTMYFDHHGKKIKFPYKIGTKNIENYPARVLRNNGSDVRRPEITINDALAKLTSTLKRPLGSGVRDLNDAITVLQVDEIYAPVFEARLVGPKKKIGIMRIDAVRNKVV